MNIETVSAQLHDVYIKEAKRQGDVRHKDAYEELPENIKEFDRVLARHIMVLLQDQLTEVEEVVEGMLDEVPKGKVQPWSHHYDEALTDILSKLRAMKDETAS